MTFDEELIALVRALGAVQSICTNKRLYHWEVLQSNPNSINFPCVVYNMASDSPVNELDGKSGMRKAEFEFDCYSKLTANIRELQGAIDTLNGNAYTVLEWVEVENTTDSFEPPIDLDEKGMKAAQVTVTVWYRDPTTTTTTAAP